ncbi:hypothetical protein OG552_29605 [Streptomyces sp. NBC_01476]|uniref:hypothetical protein n=1 Tax=Streptomyces sp. NBC_01476 TaxID=2903881 RepID=UPI002E33CCD7|nr:hypothetical protein [Streptomyces sp. NBC_01476]
MPHSMSRAAEPISGLDGMHAFVLIAIVVVVIAGVAVVPLILDVIRATAWRRQLTDRLIDRAADDQDVRDFLRDLREPRGVRGLTRSVIALLILALVGFALAVTMLSSGSDSSDLRKTIVTSLMTVLATVAGFYFGSLGAQNSAEDARRGAGARSTAKATTAPGDTTVTAGAGTDAAGGAVAGVTVEDSPADPVPSGPAGNPPPK